MDTRTDPLLPLHHVETKEYIELTSRRRCDRLARALLDRYDRQHRGKAFFEPQDWAKIDDRQISVRWITQHLEELRNEHRQRASQQRLGELEVVLRYNEITQELTVKMLKMKNVLPRYVQLLYDRKMSVT